MATAGGEICVVMDGPCGMPSSLTDFTVCPGLELLSCELLANPAAVVDVLVLNVHKTPPLYELYQDRKAWIKTLGHLPSL